MIHAAAARRRKQDEEEKMTPYGPRDLAEDWEFKILHSATAAFKNANTLQRYLAEEGQAGWALVEKFDNGRIRLKRPASVRQNDARLPSTPTARMQECLKSTSRLHCGSGLSVFSLGGHTHCPTREGIVIATPLSSSMRPAATFNESACIILRLARSGQTCQRFGHLPPNAPASILCVQKGGCFMRYHRLSATPISASMARRIGMASVGQALTRRESRHQSHYLAFAAFRFAISASRSHSAADSAYVVRELARRRSCDQDSSAG